jgi:hypothetical protein
MKHHHRIGSKNRRHRNSFLNFLLYNSIFYSILAILNWAGALVFLPEQLLSGVELLKGDFRLYTLLFEVSWIIAIYAIMEWKRWGFWVLLLISALKVVALGIFAKDIALEVSLTPLIEASFIFLVLRITGDWDYLN